MIMLGIDPGFQFAGYAIIKKDGSKITAIDYGYLKLPPTRSLSERTHMFYDFFKEKIEKNGITHLSLETPFLGKNAQNFLKLGYLRGILYLLASQYTLELSEFAPRQVKQAVTGFGGASKEQVARVVGQLFPTLAKQEKYDVTDALAVTLCGVWQNQSLYSRLQS